MNNNNKMTRCCTVHLFELFVTKNFTCIATGASVILRHSHVRLVNADSKKKDMELYT